MDWISSPEIWTALLTLTVLEIVLGVDNVIFISILASKLPKEQQDRARQMGLILAGGMRLLFLAAIGWVISLKKDLFEILGMGFSGKDLVLIAGGLFLIYKSVKEIHDKLEGEEHGMTIKKLAPSFASVIGQILLLDLVFSIDSVITAVGMTPYVPVMMASVIIAVGIMFFASRGVYDFVNRHPAVKMLALSFLLLIGFTLIAEGFEQKIPKGYVYFAIFFAVATEWLNIKAGSRSKTKPVELHNSPDMPDEN